MDWSSRQRVKAISPAFLSCILHSTRLYSQLYSWLYSGSSCFRFWPSVSSLADLPSGADCSRRFSFLFASTWSFLEPTLGPFLPFSNFRFFSLFFSFSSRLLNRLQRTRNWMSHTFKWSFPDPFQNSTLLMQYLLLACLSVIWCYPWTLASIAC